MYGILAGYLRDWCNNCPPSEDELGSPIVADGIDCPLFADEMDLPAVADGNDL